MTNFYEVLGLDQNASKDEIKASFRKQARELHPDVNSAENAEEQFKELGKAYETLMDDEKRALYDRYGEDGLKSAGYNNSGPFDFGFGNLNDIFESFFGGMEGFGGFGFGGSSNPNAPKRGADLRLDIQLEFKDAIFGVEKEITIDHLERCKSCSGSGAEPGSNPTTCPTCGGSGHVQQVTRTPLGSFTQVGVCSACRGKGKVISNPCKKCKGQGNLEVEKKLTIKIPAGVDDGSKIRISGEGDVGLNGGQTGDLYIVVHVKSHKHFKRDGYNIFTDLEISIPQAVLGDEISVETIHGDRTLTVPNGIQTGEMLSIKEAGVPVINNDKVRGDHYFLVKVLTPKKLSSEEKEIYAKLYELTTNKKYSKTFVDKFKNVLNS